MRIVSSLCKRILYPSLSKSGYFRTLDLGDAPTVLTYHGVLPPGYSRIDPQLDGAMLPVEAFDRQIAFLTRYYTVISPEQFRRWILGEVNLPSRCVLLTCDDGLLNQCRRMVPILERYGVSCLFFVLGATEMLWHEELYLMLRDKRRPFELRIPGFTSGQQVNSAGEAHLLWRSLMEKFAGLDRSRREDAMRQIRTGLDRQEDWRADYWTNPSLRERFFTMQESDLSYMVSRGMSVGAHSVSHARLSGLSDKDAREEISCSGERLRSVLPNRAWAFAYPFGDSASVGPREMRMAEEAGYVCAFVNKEGLASARPGLRFAIPRIHVTGDMSLTELEAHLSGFYRTLRMRVPGKKGAWRAASS